MKRESFEVSLAGLKLLADKVGKAYGILSPFASLPAVDSLAETEGLKKAGCIDNEDRLTEKVKPIFGTLANPHALLRCRLTAGQGMMEDTFYFAPGEAEAIRLSNRQEGLRVSYPVKAGELIEVLRPLWGDSPFQSLNVETDLPFGGAVAYAAGVDVMRRRMLAAIGLGTSYDITFSGEMLVEEAKKAKDDAQWLATVVRGMIKDELTDEEIRQGITELNKRGLVELSGELYAAGSEMLEVAGRLLLIDRLLSVRGAYMDKGEARQLGWVAVTGGMHDVLMLEATEDKMSFTGISPETALEYVEVLFEQLPLLGDRSAAEPKNAPSPQKCSACSSEIPKGAKFCPVCGKPTEGALICPKCQTVAPLGAKFCAVCGNPIS